jgi:FkbM family methyltransferase
VLSKCGFLVDAYEPDPKHFEKLKRNLILNEITTCTPHKKAVSERDGTMEFIRVLGNTTSSHLKGAKPNPYGELQSLQVAVADVRRIAERSDLLKVDAEGHEAVLLSAISDSTWAKLDAFVEVGTDENAHAIFSRFVRSGVNMFSQKTGWSQVKSLEHLPASYREGGIFISAKSKMPWGELKIEEGECFHGNRKK